MQSSKLNVSVKVCLGIILLLIASIIISCLNTDEPAYYMVGIDKDIKSHRQGDLLLIDQIIEWEGSPSADYYEVYLIYKDEELLLGTTTDTFFSFSKNNMPYYAIKSSLCSLRIKTCSRFQRSDLDLPLRVAPIPPDTPYCTVGKQEDKDVVLVNIPKLEEDQAFPLTYTLYFTTDGSQPSKESTKLDIDFSSLDTFVRNVSINGSIQSITYMSYIMENVHSQRTYRFLLDVENAVSSCPTPVEFAMILGGFTGNVHYPTNHVPAGPIIIQVYDNEEYLGDPLTYKRILTAGFFTIEINKGTYYMRAFKDYKDDGTYDETFDPYGEYEGAVDYTGDDIPSVDITLIDPPATFNGYGFYDFDKTTVDNADPTLTFSIKTVDQWGMDFPLDSPVEITLSCIDTNVIIKSGNVFSLQDYMVNHTITLYGTGETKLNATGADFSSESPIISVNIVPTNYQIRFNNASTYITSANLTSVDLTLDYPSGMINESYTFTVVSDLQPDSPKTFNGTIPNLGSIILTHDFTSVPDGSLSISSLQICNLGNGCGTSVVGDNTRMKDSTAPTCTMRFGDTSTFITTVNQTNVELLIEGSGDGCQPTDEIKYDIISMGSGAGDESISIGYVDVDTAPFNHDLSSLRDGRLYIDNIISRDAQGNESSPHRSQYSAHKNLPLDWISLTGSNYSIGYEWGTGPANEMPAQNIVISNFKMMSKEVTNFQYNECVATGVCTQHEDYSSMFQGLHSAQKPVVGVSTSMADDFCGWIGGYLPSEAQWEFAAGNGASHYMWSLDDVGGFDPTNYCYNLFPMNDPAHTTCEVGSYSPNSFGLYDMSGNVWEWCTDYYQTDWYSTLTGNPIDPVNTTVAPNKTIRGGSYINNMDGIRTSVRTGLAPGNRYFFVGFRCAEDP